MSMLKAKLESKVILDFSKGRVTKNRIRQALRKVEVLEHLKVNGVNTIRDNFIEVGMYRIQITPYALSTERRKHLREYGGIRVVIFDRSVEHGIVYWTNTTIERDKRFKHQPWTKLNKDYKIRIKHLIDIIYYCHRLNKMRAFL